MYFRDVLTMDPFREIDRLQLEMNRLFDGMSPASRQRFPEVNIWTNPEVAAVTAELPGYDPKDVNLSIVGDTLSIKGTRTKPELENGDHYHRQERLYGDFERSLRLPFAIESEKVEARFKNGVLQILLPRAEEDKPKKIEIKAAK
jgi:HSP20 family protein